MPPHIHADAPTARTRDTPARRPRRVASRVAQAVRTVASFAVVATVSWLAVRTGTVGVTLVLAGIVGSVALHEAAHLGAARAMGLKATEYFVGFGPTLWSRQRGELRWGLKLLPLGGYVKLVGMDSGEEVDPADEHRTFRAQRPGTRAAVAAAGPLANLALAAVLFAGMGIATSQGILSGIARGGSDTVAVLELSAGAVVELPATGVRLVDAALGGAPAADQERVLSPVGATRLAGQAVEAGPWFAIGLIAVINVFLGVLNLVPLLPFDGGHIALAGTERAASTLARRPVRIDPRPLRPVAFAVVAALLVLGAAAVTLDVTQPVGNPFAGPA